MVNDPFMDIYTKFMDMVNLPEKYMFTEIGLGCCGHLQGHC
jgi:hypothetical protein